MMSWFTTEGLDLTTCESSPSPVPYAMGVIRQLDQITSERAESTYATLVDSLFLRRPAGSKRRRVVSVATGKQVCHFYVFRVDDTLNKDLVKQLRFIDAEFVETEDLLQNPKWNFRDCYICLIRSDMPFQRIDGILRKFRRNTEGPYWGAGREFGATGGGEETRRKPKKVVDPRPLIVYLGDCAAGMVQISEHDSVDLYPDTWDYDLAAWQKCCEAWPQFSRCYQMLLVGLGQAQNIYARDGTNSDLKFWTDFERECDAWIRETLGHLPQKSRPTPTLPIEPVRKDFAPTRNVEHEFSQRDRMTKNTKTPREPYPSIG